MQARTSFSSRVPLRPQRASKSSLLRVLHPHHRVDLHGHGDPRPAVPLSLSSLCYCQNSFVSLEKRSSKCPTRKTKFPGAHFFFRGRWEIANRNSRNLHDTQKPDKNGCRAVWMHSCTKPVLRRTSGGAAPESNCVPFHTPIPGRADPEQARQATSSINADTRRDETQSEVQARGREVIDWCGGLKNPNTSRPSSSFFLLGVPAAASALACRLRTTVWSPRQHKRVITWRVRSNRGRLLLSYLNQDDC